MTKVLFGQSYFMRFDPKLWQAMQPYPPLGTLYAAAYARSLGYRVALFDAMLAESEADWEHALEREQPNIAVLYEDNFNYLSKMCLLRMRQAAFRMIEMARGKGVPVVVAGSDASDHAAQYLDRGADYVIIGEGEITLGELIPILAGDSDQAPQEVLGLAWKDPDANSGYSRSSPRPDIRDLDSLPWPAWDLVDVEKYRRLWLENHGYFSLNMVTTRGCPFHCNWCAKPIWGQRYHSRSPEQVAQELGWLKKAYRPDHIWFVDDIMGLKPGWVEKFADAAHALDAVVPFKCLSRVDLLLRDGEIEALQRAGAEIVWVGAESGSQKILDAMEKGTRVSQIHTAADRLREADIRVGFFLQFGYPGETRQDIEATLQMVRDILPDDIGMSVSYPLPGTRFHARVQDQLGEQQNWQDSSDLAMLFHGPFSTAYYRQLHTVLHKEYRARKILAGLRKRETGLRETAALIWHGLTLPLEQARLQRLAQARPPELSLSGQGMSPEQAARPTRQDHD